MKYFIPYFLIIAFILRSEGALSQGIQFDHPRTGNSYLDPSLEKDIEFSIRFGLRWLINNQEPNGSWQNYPAITALVLSSLLKSDYNFNINDTVILKGFQFLQNCVQKDGGIYLDEIANYNTSICLMAFKEIKNPDFTKIITDAEDYLISNQLDENEGYTKDSLNYGAMGYKGKINADVSNLQWSIEAIKISDVTDLEHNLSEKDKEQIRKKNMYCEKALIFLSRCQNNQSTNDQDYALNDGGFMYGAGISKLEGVTSYGSMTYAGLKSMIYAELGKEDPRVKAAHKWITSNFSIENNPGLGDAGLYYYYLTMAKALDAFGEEKIPDPDGTVHDWRKELSIKIITLQNEEGWWQNENNRWWENNRILATAYCLLALEQILN